MRGVKRIKKMDEKSATDKQRADKEGIFRSNFHDYCTTMVSFSNSPSADTRLSPHTQITGKAPEGLALAYPDSITEILKILQ